MGMNKYQPHVVVLPEDDATRQLAVGFSLGMHQTCPLDVKDPAGGWTHVLQLFVTEYLPKFRKDKGNLHLVMLIDFDNNLERLETMRERIPDELKGRVFVIGAWSAAEKLRQGQYGSFEKIGLSLAQDCQEERPWNHELLQHIDEEIKDMTKALKPILF